MSLLTILNDYKTKTASYAGYIGKAFLQDSSERYLLSLDEQSFIVDSAFLRIFIAWETFLEEAFVGYLMGEQSSSGRAANRFAIPTTETHARQLLIGAQKYVDWANPELVRKLAQLYFENGEPIAPTIASIQADLFDLKTIRNAAAHLTSTTNRALDGLASRKLGRTSTKVNVSDLLLSLDPSVNNVRTILDSYLDLLDSASQSIISWQ